MNTQLDIIIRRTLVYSMLTALLALTYFGSVVLLQRLLPGVTGPDQNQFVIVMTMQPARIGLWLRKDAQNATRNPVDLNRKTTSSKQL